MSLTINKHLVRRFALDCARQRAHKFTRVSAEFYSRADAALKRWIVSEIQQLPSKGKTVR